MEVEKIMNMGKLLVGEASYYLLMLLCVWHVGQAFSKRLWLLPSHPSRLFALNAGTLALLGTFITFVGADLEQYSTDYSTPDVMFFRGVFICAAVGALVPSLAASTDARDMWSTVLAVAVLILSSSIFILFLLLSYISKWHLVNHSVYLIVSRVTATEHKAVMASLLLLLLVLVVQAMALEEMILDVNSLVLQQLRHLDCCLLEAKPRFKAQLVPCRPINWSWEVMECNARIKLMMGLTSNAQNVMARSPSGAIVGALVLFRVILQFQHVGTYTLLPISVLVPFGFISVWRWARAALQEDRFCLSLVFDAEPSYWRRKVNNFRHALKAGPCAAQPNVVFYEGQYGFREVVRHTTAFLILCFVIPVHWLLVALIRFSHILSVFLVQALIWLPARTLGCGIMASLSRETPGVDTVAGSATNLDSLGVICLEGENARVVRREFASAANLIIQRQLKKAKTKSDLKALISLLKLCKNPSSLLEKSNGILHVLHQDGAPYVENLHVEHGYQYGWSLTLVSLLVILTKIEVAALGAPHVSMAAMNACWQAMEMMQVVDEQFEPCIVCSKETYARALASEWSKLQKKKWRGSLQEGEQVRPAEVKLEVVGQVLMAILEPEERHMEEFNKTRSTTARGYKAWSQQTVVSYTMHTVCRNVSRQWSGDLESAAMTNGFVGGSNDESESESESGRIIKGMIEQMNGWIAEVLACCLFNLPTALDMSMTEAVVSGNVSKIEKGLLLVGQGKRLWQELQWPTTIHSSKSTAGLGQLRQWIHHPPLNEL